MTPNFLTPLSPGTPFHQHQVMKSYLQGKGVEWYLIEPYLDGMPAGQELKDYLESKGVALEQEFINGEPQRNIWISI